MKPFNISRENIFNKLKFSSYVGIFVNLILTIAKFYGGIAGNSEALVADGFNSLSDIFAGSSEGWTLIILYGNFETNSLESIFIKPARIIYFILYFSIMFSSALSKSFLSEREVKGIVKIGISGEVFLTLPITGAPSIFETTADIFTKPEPVLLM